MDHKTVDLTCIECHKSKTQALQKCTNCDRVFHLHCIKNDQEREKQISKWSYHSLNFTKTLNGANRKQGEVRNRSETPNSIENNGAEQIDVKLCYPCTLVERGKEYPEAQISPEEINYMLGFVVDRVISWVRDDTVGVKEIHTKIAELQYTVLEELLVDILDMAHRESLEKGLHSEPHEACNFLFADALYEISEVHQCIDCYRHSNEMFEKNWFALPCSAKRHELVYAKMHGYPYWPAKVIKITEGTYDVRFFGGDHSRCEISRHFIKPIDSNIQNLNKTPPTKALKEALVELETHRKLMMQNASQFSFEAEREIRQLKAHKRGQKRKQESLTPKLTPKSSIKRRRPNETPKPSSSKLNLKKVDEPQEEANLLEMEKNHRTRGDIQKIIEKISPTPPPPPVAESSTPTPTSSKSKPKIGPKSVMERRAKLEKLNSEASPKKTSPVKKAVDEPQIPDSSTEMLNRSPRIKSQFIDKQSSVLKIQSILETIQDLDQVKKVAVDLFAKEVDYWQVKLSDMREYHKRQISKIKEKQWCCTCKELAVYYCCWNTSYCSKDCQASHWVQGHNKQCLRTQNSN